MSKENKPKHVRDLEPGQTFRLCRNGDIYTLIRREINILRNGVRYVVTHQGFAHLTTLHHSCRVVLLESGGVV